MPPASSAAKKRSIPKLPAKLSARARRTWNKSMPSEMHHLSPTIDATSFKHVNEIIEHLHTTPFPVESIAALSVPHTLLFNEFLLFSSMVCDNISSPCRILIFDDKLNRIILRSGAGILMMWDFTQDEKFVLH